MLLYWQGSVSIKSIQSSLLCYIGKLHEGQWMTTSAKYKSKIQSLSYDYMTMGDV